MITLTYIKSKILQDCLSIKLRPSMNKIHRYKLDLDRGACNAYQK